MKLQAVFSGVLLLAMAGCSSSLETSTYAEEGQPGNVFTSGGGEKRTFGGCALTTGDCFEFDSNGGRSQAEGSGAVSEQAVPEGCLYQIFGGIPSSVAQEPREDGALRLRAAFEGTPVTRARVFVSLEAAIEICPELAPYFQ